MLASAPVFERRWRGFGRWLALLSFSVISVIYVAQAVASGPDGDLDSRFESLRGVDIRLATVLFRLAESNDELCLKHGPLTGLVLHGSQDYDASAHAAAMRYFDFQSPIGIEGVVAGSPAARAGIRPDDSIMAIGGIAIGTDETARQARAAIDASGAQRPLTLGLRRANQTMDVSITPVAGCLVHGEVAISDDLNAATDGDTIQVDSALMNLISDDDDELAAVVAHELAHIVLDHPDRLTAAHVSRGMFKGFGRSARLFKQTETEADRLSVTLMANAGYDPQAAVRYWRTHGPQLNDHGGRGSTHLAWQARADLIAAEAARVAKEPQRPILPGWISSRDQPLR